MENDDRPIGWVLSRREALALLGTAGAAFLAACAGLAETDQTTEEPASTPSVVTTQGAAQATSETLPACVVRPEMTEGPYYVDADLNRSDIRSDPSTGEVKDGALLALTFLVSQVGESGCTPLEGAKVEIWHCDAAGVYSGVTDPGFDTTGQKFLRGYQATGADGKAAFVTIYPGWYSGRTVHIHFKIRHDGTDQSREFTSQLFFDDAFTDQVYTQEPYASRGPRNTLNSTDRIYDDRLLLAVAQTDRGYAATLAIGMEMA
jgi:protocatechuate 3,4-dioxygenase beta subunit